MVTLHGKSENGVKQSAPPHTEQNLHHYFVFGFINNHKPQPCLFSQNMKGFHCLVASFDQKKKFFFVYLDVFQMLIPCLDAKPYISCKQSKVVIY